MAATSRGLTAHLDEIADLGATAIWITPVVKNIDGFVTGAGFPDWGYHGYWADDFYRLDPRFGTEAELKTLVDEAHARGMKVLLDVVYNHAGYDSNLTRRPDAPAAGSASRRWRPAARTTSPLCVSGLPDFKTELPEVDDYLLKAHLGLAEAGGGGRLPARHGQARPARLLEGAPAAHPRRAREGLLPDRRGLGRRRPVARPLVRGRRDGRRLRLLLPGERPRLGPGPRAHGRPSTAT